jgi:hypothetical protein
VTRYIVVHHPDQHSRLAIHHLLRSYHWESIDSEHVLVLADVEPSHLGLLDSRPDVLLAPSLYSEEPLQVHAEKTDASVHYLKLKKHLGITDQHKTVHLAARAAQRYGMKMSLDL